LADSGLEPQSGKIKDYKIDSLLSRKSKDGLGQNQNKVFEWRFDKDK
jgi:hypothetical protein